VGGDDVAEAEVESLRRTLQYQEERIVQLRKDLEVSREREEKRSIEAEVARAEVTRLTEELRLERQARAEVETAAAEQQAAAEMATRAAQAAAGLPSPQARSSSQGRRAAPRPVSASVSAGGDEFAHEDNGGTPQGSMQSWSTPVNAVPIAARATAAAPPPARRNMAPASASSSAAPSAAPSARRTASVDAQGRRGGNRSKAAATDDIDVRLQELLRRLNSRLVFRRMNRGWYAFRRAADYEECSVEISIVNQKLMARLEPSTHDPGWNNGKLGSIERFIACFDT
jgi:hypothetical protein